MGLKTKLRKLLRRRQTLDQVATRVEDMEVQMRQWMSLAELEV